MHFGGMTEPFQPVDRGFQVTTRLLDLLHKYDYPVVISTKSDLIVEREYFTRVTRLRYVNVQVSLTSLDKRFSSLVEPGAPSPRRRLEVMVKLAEAGIPITCRFQPFMPHTVREPIRLFRAISGAGCSHVIVEFLKYPVEGMDAREKAALDRACGYNVLEFFQKNGAVMRGREYELPSQVKAGLLPEIVSAIRTFGMTYGAGDNDLHDQSDTACCCGVDKLPGFDNWYRHQYGYASWKSKRELKYNSIKREWSPKGRVNDFVNSKCRLRAADGRELPESMADYARRMWNSTRISGCPGCSANFTEERVAADGLKVFKRVDLVQLKV